MSFEERNVWVFLVVAVLVYAAYVVVVLSRAQDVPLTEVAYVGPLLWSIGGAIVASIVGSIAVGLANRRDGHLTDQRDKEINRLGERRASRSSSIGAPRRDGPGPGRGRTGSGSPTSIYLCFVLSAILGSVTKLVAYRRDFSAW